MELYLLLLFFFLSCLFLPYFGTVFCADHVPGAHVPSALAQIPHLLGNIEQRWSWMAGGGGGGELGGAGRAGSIPGQRELLALHIPVCWSEGPRQGHALGRTLWNDQSLCRCWPVTAPAGLADAQHCMWSGEILFSVFHHFKNINSCSSHTFSSSPNLVPLRHFFS